MGVKKCNTGHTRETLSKSLSQAAHH